MSNPTKNDAMEQNQQETASGNKPTKRKKNWREVYASVTDIQNFLSERVMLRYNVVTHQTEVHWLTSFGDDYSKPAVWERINDRIENSLWKELSKVKPVRMRDLQYVIGSDYVPAYHPFRFYVENLPPWREEQGDNIMELSLSVNVKGDGDEQIRFYQYLKKWLVAMVASWMDDRVVNNVMLVLIGEQGAYKTTWFAHLLPPPLREYFYTKTNSGLVSKDDLLVLSQYGLVCWEELDTMQQKELNKLKAAMTMPSINERAAYARYHENRPHLASFCGTGNNVQFLSDTTGTRRWLPFEVDSIESPLTAPFNYDAIYAQAYRLYCDGFRFWFDRQEIERLSHHNRQFETTHREEEMVDIFFRVPAEHETAVFMPVSRAIQMIGSYHPSLRLDYMRMGLAFKKQGFRQKRTKYSRGWLVIQRSGAEIEQRLKDLALDSGDG